MKSPLEKAKKLIWKLLFLALLGGAATIVTVNGAGVIAGVILMTITGVLYLLYGIREEQRKQTETQQMMLNEMYSFNSNLLFVSTKGGLQFDSSPKTSIDHVTGIKS
jgi:hypothetical protein